MMRAYEENLLWITQDTLGRIFEICLDDERMPTNEFTDRILCSDPVRNIEDGYLWYVMGRSATQMAEELLGRGLTSYHEPVYGPTYWTGHVYTYVQWMTCRSFNEIIEAYPIERLLSMYRPFHEADISKIAYEMTSELCGENRLKQLRRQGLLTQEELAKASGISVKTIRAYEQNILDLKKARGETLYLLARALHCRMEDLIV